MSDASAPRGSDAGSVAGCFTCPMPRVRVVDEYYLEHRAKALDIAAFFDRLDRSSPACSGVSEDFRVVALRRALCILVDGHPHKARRLQESLSDTGEGLLPAAIQQGAFGAPVSGGAS